MKSVLADTSFYAAFLSPRDARHRIAVGLSNANHGTILTTEFVLIELANSFSRLPGRARVTIFLKFLQDDENTVIVPASSELVRRGFELFEQRVDKEWSLTDCISFAVMEERGVRDALTSDAHFEQAGFKALML